MRNERKPGMLAWGILELLSGQGQSIEGKAAALVLAETVLAHRRFLSENTNMQRTQHNTNRLVQSLGKLIGKRGV